MFLNSTLNPVRQTHSRAIGCSFCSSTQFQPETDPASSRIDQFLANNGRSLAVHARKWATLNFDIQFAPGVFGVNSRKKPGPAGVNVPMLLFWKHEWCWVFHGMAFGIPSTASLYKDTRGVRTIDGWEPIQGPELLAWKPTNQRPREFQQIDAARLREWESKPEHKKWKRVVQWI